MNTGIVPTILTLAAFCVLGGCASNPMDTQHDTLPAPMISAEEFDAMISIEVRTLGPHTVGEAAPQRESESVTMVHESLASL